MARTHSHRTLTALVRGPCANAESWRGTPPHCAGKRAAPRGKARAAPAAAVDHPLLERAPPQFGDALRARRQLRGGEADLGSHLLEREVGGAARDLQVRLHRGARARLAAGSSPCAARAMWLSPRQWPPPTPPPPPIPAHPAPPPIRPRALSAPAPRRAAGQAPSSPTHPPTHPPCAQHVILRAFPPLARIVNTLSPRPRPHPRSADGMTASHPQMTHLDPHNHACMTGSCQRHRDTVPPPTMHCTAIHPQPEPRPANTTKGLAQSTSRWYRRQIKYKP